MKLIRKLPMRLNKNGNPESWAIFKCPIDNEEVEKLLSNGKIAKSCGSLNCKKSKRNYKHGETGSRLYTIWTDMKQRILNPEATGYKNYGGRDIIICPEWANDYVKFRDWSLANGYADNLEIDRENNDGNYEPSNCQWLTRKENSQKTRRNVIKNMEIANEIRRLDKTGLYTQKQLAEMFNVSDATISDIINNKIWK